MKIEDNDKQQTQTMAPLLLFAINDTKTIICQKFTVVVLVRNIKKKAFRFSSKRNRLLFWVCFVFLLSIKVIVDNCQLHDPKYHNWYKY